METRRGVADESRDARHAFILSQNGRQRIGHEGGLLLGSSFAKMDLHGEELPLGFRQELEIEVREKHDADDDGGDQHAPNHHRMEEANPEDTSIRALEPGEETRLYPLHEIHLFGFTLTHKTESEVRGDPRGVEDRRHEGKEDRPREELDELAQRSRDDTGHREEHTADRHGSQRHRHEEHAGTDYSGVPARVTAREDIRISVDDDDAVVHDHS